MRSEMPIGIFDSGIGGISVLKQFVRYLPYESYVYLGDTARVPYGNRSEEIVKSYSEECTEFLLKKGVKLIVVACNTVSSIALDTIRSLSGGIPVIGMIQPAVAAALRSSVNRKIGIIGTRATIRSKAYEKTIAELASGERIETESVACPLFVPIIEEGLLDHEATRLLANDYLAQFRTNGVDSLIMACTHYPLLKQLFGELLPGINLIDSGEHAAVSAIRTLAEMGALAPEGKSYVPVPSIEFFVTDIPYTFLEVAQRFLGFSIGTPQKISFD